MNSRITDSRLKTGSDRPGHTSYNELTSLRRYRYQSLLLDLLVYDIRQYLHESTLFNFRLNNLRSKSRASSKIDQVLKRVTPLYIIFDGGWRHLFSLLLIRDGEQMDVTLRQVKNGSLGKLGDAGFLQAAGFLTF